MKLSAEEISKHKDPFFRTFLFYLNDLIGEKWNIVYKVHRPRSGHRENIENIDKKTALILWGDEESSVFPSLYFKAAGAIIKCYCPEAWCDKGIIPMTDGAMIYNPQDNTKPSLCSSRPYDVFFSANLNYRRTDIFRGLSNHSFGYPFRISSNYPKTGSYPLWHKIEAVLAHKIIVKMDRRRDFSHLYENSYIRFHDGFMQGGLSPEEYNHRMFNSKISWSTAGFMTNETSRLIESAFAGTAVICGNLPSTPIYQGHPFHVINDWRTIRKTTDMILNNQDYLNELGIRGREWFDSHFSPQAQAERIAKVLSC